MCSLTLLLLLVLFSFINADVCGFYYDGVHKINTFNGNNTRHPGNSPSTVDLQDFSGNGDVDIDTGIFWYGSISEFVGWPLNNTGNPIIFPLESDYSVLITVVHPTTHVVYFLSEFNHIFSTSPPYTKLVLEATTSPTGTTIDGGTQIGFVNLVENTLWFQYTDNTDSIWYIFDIDTKQISEKNFGWTRFYAAHNVPDINEVVMVYLTPSNQWGLYKMFLDTSNTVTTQQILTFDTYDDKDLFLGGMAVETDDDSDDYYYIHTMMGNLKTAGPSEFYLFTIKTSESGTGTGTSTKVPQVNKVPLCKADLGCPSQIFSC